MGVDWKSDDVCYHCHKQFCEHNYEPDSIDVYNCPHPVQESYYGHFNGGDPRDFHPDAECCTKEELSNHRRACDLWYDAEADGKTPEPEACPSGWIYGDDGKPLAHVLRAPYGIGTMTMTYESKFEPIEEGDDDPYDHLAETGRWLDP